MNFTTEPAMIATCGRCLTKSAPTDRDGAKEFAELHERRHEAESRRKFMALMGHYVTFEIKSTTIKTTGWPICSCGWSGEPGKVELMLDVADGHLKEHASKV